MGKLRDLSGKRFGKLLVIDRAGSSYRRNSNSHRDATWRCVCDCGNEKIYVSYNLLKGRTISCGCSRRKKSKIGGAYKTKEYRTWTRMIQRCENKNYNHFIYYGGRGIRISERWRKSYDNFIKDMGQCPDGYSLDRIDVNGNYESLNCRWANNTTQARNQRVAINNKIGIRGIGLLRNGKFRVRIHINRKPIHIGTFDDIDDAMKARKDAELKYWQ